MMIFVLAGLLPAQDMQNRSVLRLVVDVNDHWYIPVWSITNLKTESPVNTNIFAGVGYRGQSWWVEGLAQKQWSPSGGLWSADARYRQQFGRVSVYVEPSVIRFPKAAFYEFVTVEEKVWKGLSLRQETENVHRLGKDSIAAGGGMSYVFGSWRGCDATIALVYRASPTGPDELRTYLVVARRFRLRR